MNQISLPDPKFLSQFKWFHRWLAFIKRKVKKRVNQPPFLETAQTSSSRFKTIKQFRPGQIFPRGRKLIQTDLVWLKVDPRLSEVASSRFEVGLKLAEVGIKLVYALSSFVERWTTLNLPKLVQKFTIGEIENNTASGPARCSACRRLQQGFGSGLYTVVVANRPARL